MREAGFVHESFLFIVDFRSFEFRCAGGYETNPYPRHWRRYRRAGNDRRAQGDPGYLEKITA